MDSLNRFNWIAAGYDRLTRLVYGKALYESQVCFLALIPPGCNILIMGGGSGAVLRKLFSLNPGARVWYIEASSRMIELTSQKLSAAERKQTTFIHGTEKSIPQDISVDVIITHFFLDLFPYAHLLASCRRLSAKLRLKGLWIVSDFVDGGIWWQRLLLWVMYRFFRVTCGISAEKLPAWGLALSLAAMKERRFQSFFSGFIKSTVYEKTEETWASYG